MKEITAYFLGGPKHGDVDIVSGDARDVRIPINNQTFMDTRRAMVDEGHYSYMRDMPLDYTTGLYRREHELYGVPGMNTSRKNVLFLWAGLTT